MKSYTDLEQSKKLAKILPIESADMFYSDIFIDEKHKYNFHYLETYGFKTFEDTKIRESAHLGFIPCWSLAALLGILPNYQLQTQDDGIGILCSYNGKFNVVTADNPVDACVAMIEKLNELKML